MNSDFLTLEDTIFMIRKWIPVEIICDLIQQPKMYLELEVFVIGMHTLVHKAHMPYHETQGRSHKEA